MDIYDDLEDDSLEHFIYNRLLYMLSTKYFICFKSLNLNDNNKSFQTPEESSDFLIDGFTINVIV